MQPQRLVEFGNHGRRQLSKACPEAPDAKRSDLFDPGFGRACQSGGAGLQERFATQVVVATILSLRPGGSR
jgi:hypothetical protein